MKDKIIKRRCPLGGGHDNIGSSRGDSAGSTYEPLPTVYFLPSTKITAIRRDVRVV